MSHDTVESASSPNPPGPSRRALRQQLESWQAAGVAHLPRCGSNPAPPTSAPEMATCANAQPLEPSASPPQTSPSSADGASPTQSAARPAPSPSLFDDAPKPATRLPATLRRADRVSQLNVLAEQVAQCRRCAVLAETRTQTVFGVGNPEARLVFVGEAPGADEDRQGEPFVGRAGKLLNDIIAACRLKREDIYICNILKCRPPDNRTPLPDECANCREYLQAQLQTIDPDYVVCWGAVAAQNLLNSPFSIGKLRGRFFQYGRAKVLCTYHPSYLLRNPAAKKDVWDDMKFLFADMGVDLGKKAGS